jgi:coenzyme F420-0:L-glutamate ligase/coenzyme F420-1:gamma-L-glutamate ligase
MNRRPAGSLEHVTRNKSEKLVARRLELIAPENFPLVGPGDEIAQLILDSLRDNQIALRKGDVLVLAQKIVSKAEDRFVNLTDIEPSDAARELAIKCDKDARLVQLILNESSEVLRTTPGVIIVRHKLGLVMANAGIDHSNIAGSAGGNRVLLLPENPDASAQRLRQELERETKLELAIVISDSFGRPWRLGTTGVCIGCDGIAALLDKRGDKDMFGQELMVTQIAIGDELATAASLLMGQTDEARPLVIVRGLDVPREPASARFLQRPRDEDLFR